jgi:MraZ protein
MTGLFQPFISAVPGALDGKGRVCIPAPYREILTTQGTAGVYVCPSVIDPVLDAFGQTLLDDTTRRYADQDPFFSPGFDDDATALIARTQLLKMDATGRVSLPETMIVHAGLSEKVVFVGKLRKFQIMDAARYAEIEAAALARVKARYERGRSEGA